MTGSLVTRTPGPGPAWKLTALRKNRIVAAVQAGNFDYVAAKAAGIGNSTFMKYKALGRDLLQRALDAGIIDPEEVEDAEQLAALEYESAKEQGNQKPPKPPNAIGQVLRAAGWPEHEVLLVELVDELDRADAEAECRLINLMSVHAQKHWQAASKLASVRFRDRWRDETTLVGAGGGPIQMEVEVLEGDLAAAIQANPAALALASQLLAQVAPLELEEGIDPEADHDAEVEDREPAYVGADDLGDGDDVIEAHLADED